MADDLRALAAADPDRPAFVTGRGGKTLTLSYGELDRHIDRFASALRSLEPRPRAVAYQLPDWWETVALTLACLRSGIVAVPLLAGLGERELRNALALTGADTLITLGGPRAETAAKAAEGLPAGSRRVVYAETPEPGALDFAGLFLTAEPEPEPEPVTMAVDPDRVSLVLFTSGTTGRAKAALHTANTLYAGGRALVGAVGGGHRVSATAQTVSHIGGLGFGVLAPLVSGGTGVFQDTPTDHAAFLELLDSAGVEYVVAVPVRLNVLVAEIRQGAAAPRALRDILTGATAPPPALIKEAEAAFPGVRVRSAFAATEICTLSMVPADAPSGTSAHSDGMPVSGVEIAPADSPDEVQPLRVRGPSVCLATGDADGLRLTWEHDDGWYSTGDLIRRLPDGSVRFMSRTAERVGGSFLVPVRDVEAVLDEHPSVDEAVLVGVPDDLGNEQVCAVVTPGSTTPTLDELRAHLTGRGVTDWFQPTLLYVVDAIPRDHLGKPRRGELRDRCTA